MPHQELPQPGDVIAGKYMVERFLGRGGMGAVYVVSHRLTGKKLALKCLLPEHMEQAEIVERFLREAQAAGRIQHRHVVDVFDVGSDADALYIVMEYLEGKSFSELLHDEALTLEETLGILVRAMEGVAAAHALGIVHRDLKPDNIFVCVGTSGRLDDPRVLDFGISKVEDSAAQPLTRSGVAMGTPYYMSLEQMSGQRDLDARVDVYAMGVILYEAIAGQPPHVADSVSALAIRMLTTPALHLGQIRPDLPAGLADVVMKAISRDREHRYPSMQALIEALRPFVPQAAGLLLPEGQGRPLRTPRSGSARSVAAPALLTAPTTPPSSPQHGATRGRLSVESAPTLEAPVTPRSAPVVEALPSERREQPARRGPSRAIAAVACVALLALAVWWFGLQKGADEAVSHAPPPAPPVGAGAAEAKPQTLPAPATASASLPAPASEPARPEVPAPEVAVSPTDAMPAQVESGKRRRRASSARTQPAEPEPQPAREPAEPERTVKARAGELDVEEF